MKQGEIIKIDLGEKEGHEEHGYRPYICLSNHEVFHYTRVAIFAPISNTPRDCPLYVHLEGTETTGKVLLDQIVSIDFEARIYHYQETVSDEFLDVILAKIKMLFTKDSF